MNWPSKGCLTLRWTLEGKTHPCPLPPHRYLHTNSLVNTCAQQAYTLHKGIWERRSLGSLKDLGSTKGVYENIPTPYSPLFSWIPKASPWLEFVDTACGQSWALSPSWGDPTFTERSLHWYALSILSSGACTLLVGAKVASS